jgi:hypothetical protein
MTTRHLGVNHPSPISRGYDTIAYEVQGMLSAQSLLFSIDSSLNNPPEKPSGSPIREISDIGL